MKLLRIAVLLSLGIVVGFFAARYSVHSSLDLISPVIPNPTPRPLQKYSYPELIKYIPQASKIEITEEMFKEDGLVAYKAQFTTNQKKMTMQIMVPDAATPSAGFPAILMVRGFVDPTIYKTGIGTKNAARAFARNGYVTVAPDFLGFGDSDAPPIDTLEARFERPQQLLDLLSSLNTLSIINEDQVGIWGHSNGGQITISLLEVSGRPYPTVLWAPVTKPFPYSILYYADDSDDGGKELRKVLANFEKDYDVYDFTTDKYISLITAPVEIHQGNADTAVPIAWSNKFVELLKKEGKDVTYFTYDGADHNLQPAWGTAMQRSLLFFNKNL